MEVGQRKYVWGSETGFIMMKLAKSQSPSMYSRHTPLVSESKALKCQFLVRLVVPGPGYAGK